MFFLAYYCRLATVLVERAKLVVEVVCGQSVISVLVGKYDFTRLLMFMQNELLLIRPFWRAGSWAVPFFLSLRGKKPPLLWANPLILWKWGWKTFWVIQWHGQLLWTGPVREPAIWVSRPFWQTLFHYEVDVVKFATLWNWWRQSVRP